VATEYLVGYYTVPCICIPLLFSLTIICDVLQKPIGELRLWLCAAAEMSLTEQKKIDDSVLLFVASSTALQFHFALAYHFDLFNSKQLKGINFMQKEKPTLFTDLPRCVG